MREICPEGIRKWSVFQLLKLTSYLAQESGSRNRAESMPIHGDAMHLDYNMSYTRKAGRSSSFGAEFDTAPSVRSSISVFSLIF